MGYYLAIQGRQQGPFDKDQLRTQGVRADTLVWTEGMSEWQRADQVPELSDILVGQPTPALPHAPGYAGYAQPPVTSNRVVAGVLAILLGHFGIHKFVLGYTTAGLIMLLVSLLTCGLGAAVMWVIAVIEGIIYLTKTDEQFIQTYQLQQKDWF